ncbi:hypothetical protein NP493_386g04031 [Ridgeia piscesae]|uniref:Secreted protein n=1 Tax=Ridgeia piscesae TaxID=27915 RepID=A0AAD9L1T4_RIDPI|nr:hypothetical protein NP493_386g04031 [Ridgeia piscesae]
MSLRTFLFWSTTSSSLRSLASCCGPTVTGAAVTGEVAATPTGAIRWGGGRNGPSFTDVGLWAATLPLAGSSGDSPDVLAGVWIGAMWSREVMGNSIPLPLRSW